MKNVKMIFAASAIVLGAASIQANAANVPSVDTHPGHGGYTVPTQQIVQEQVSPLTGTNSNGVDTAPGR